MKFDDLPKEIKEFKDKFGEPELLRFWSQPMIHTGGFSPAQLCEKGDKTKIQEIVTLLNHYLS
ncbi:MAG: hypothetical protein A2918_03780 [Candidatus Yanofskybacteria bacterium RIFCSPLOWO2_01_FULL_42_49]|uniref:Antitoxin Xre/MbcA/ParS-like toxin-binding domain-containing protein n=1 Tax=Candidatus Yanofskybacteria bacterium RIFCSPLOWO2_01_FULL_42_49 TaxID=1802694 RepID=A0A1F8GCX1_9BACT|nr:MAG: hypothetical protein A2918_03780 [Candidatus Yanofskybacteria bacterium RIFCSPLOWO2_01_FULL_42_49]